MVKWNNTNEVKEYHKEYHKKYYKENKNKIKLQNKKYQKDNKEYYIKYNYNYYKKNKEKMYDSNKKWQMENRKNNFCIDCNQKIFNNGERCKSCAKKGEKHPNWQDGKSFEPYGVEFNNKFKKAIRKRDNQICMLCGIHREKLNRTLDVHHISYDKKCNLPPNCISLCRKCHMLTNKDRKHWTKHFQSLLMEKYGYQYSENQEIILEVKQR